MSEEINRPFTNEDKQVLGDLIHHYIEHESLNDEQKQSLNNLLRESSGARDYYEKMMETHLNLQWLIAPQSVSLPSGMESLSRQKSTMPFTSRKQSGTVRRTSRYIQARHTFHAIWMTAAACFLIGVSIYLMDPDPAIQQAPPDYFTRVVYTDQVIKGGSHNTTQEGSWLSGGTVHLEQGQMGLILDSGVQMQLTGPVKMELRSPKQCYLDYGDIATRVPETDDKFTLHTNTGSFTETATEFAVNATETISKVQVFEGKVRALTETYSGENLEKIIGTHEAYKIKDADFYKVKPGKDTKLSGLDRQRFKLNKPDYVSFDLNNINQIQSSKVNGRRYQGRVANRYNLKHLPLSRPGPFGQAALFRGKGDYIETDFPGIKGQMPRSVSFWVKVPRKLNGMGGKSIVSWGKVGGGKRWQIGICVNPKFGNLGAIRTDYNGGYVTGSTDLRDGQWHFITSVFVGSDDPNKAIDIRHYIDGKLEAVSGYLYRQIDTNTNSEAKSLHIGYWDSWSAQKADKAESTFKGAVDEVKVFNGALYPSQILELMKYNAFLPEE